MRRQITLIALLLSALLVSSAWASSAKPPLSGAPEGKVLELYREFAWEAVLEAPQEKGLLDQPKKVLSRYFDSNLTELILGDRACARKEGVCRLDFLPIWASQDPAATDLRVEKSDRNDVVLVSFRQPGTDKRMILRYRLSRTSKGWRISDISSTEWSLLAILKGKTTD